MSSAQKPSHRESHVMRIIFAGIASVSAASVTHPIDTLKIRLQIQGEMGKRGSKEAYDNIFKAFQVVYKNEGMRGLYKGVSASFMRESIYSSLRLGLYEPIKTLMGATDPHNTPFYLKLVSAGMSGFIGAALANPCDLIKVRMQAWEAEPQ